MPTPPIVMSHLLSGSSEQVDEQEILAALRDDRLAWVHVDGTHPDAQDWIRRELSYLDPQAVEALVDVDTRPRMAELGEGVMLILRAINFNTGEDPEDMISLRMYLDARRIVTVSRKRVRAVTDMHEAILAGRVPESAGAFLVQIVEHITGNIGRFQRDLDASAETLEDKVFGAQGDAARREVLDLRLKVIAARRYLGPQRDALHELAAACSEVIDDVTRREVEEEALKMTRITEDMDELRDQAQVLREELSTQLSDRVNKNTFVLSVVSVIFLPLGFLTGLFGVNVAGMPGIDDPEAFLMLCLWCGLLVVVQLGIMWRLRWLGGRRSSER